MAELQSIGESPDVHNGLEAAKRPISRSSPIDQACSHTRSAFWRLRNRAAMLRISGQAKLRFSQAKKLRSSIHGATMDQSATDQALSIFIDDRQQLIRLACRIVESRAIAEEIVQESWIRWHRHDYEPARAKPIFRKIVANLARDWRRSKTSELGALNELFEMRQHVPSAEAAVIARSELLLILKTLRSLPSRNVRAFRMRALEGKTYKQISERLKLSISHSHALVESVLVELTLALEE